MLLRNLTPLRAQRKGVRFLSKVNVGDKELVGMHFEDIRHHRHPHQPENRQILG